MDVIEADEQLHTGRTNSSGRRYRLHAGAGLQLLLETAFLDQFSLKWWDWRPNDRAGMMASRFLLRLRLGSALPLVATGTPTRILQFFHEIADLPEPEKSDVAAALREMLLNAIENGWRFDPSQYVEVSYLHARQVVMSRVKKPVKVSR